MTRDTNMTTQVLEMLLSWEEARQECSYRGGYRRDGELASINTREEQTFMQSTSHPATNISPLQSLSSLHLHFAESS